MSGWMDCVNQAKLNDWYEKEVGDLGNTKEFVYKKMELMNISKNKALNSIEDKKYLFTDE